MRDWVKNAWDTAKKTVSNLFNQNQATPTTTSTDTNTDVPLTTTTTTTNKTWPSTNNTTPTLLKSNLWNTLLDWPKQTLDQVAWTWAWESWDEIINSTTEWVTVSGSNVNKEEEKRLATQLAKEKQENEENASKTFTNWIKNIPNSVSSFINWLHADSDKQATEKNVAVGYNEKNWNVMYLDLNKTDWTEERFNQLFEQYQGIENSDASDVEKFMALQDFYDKSKDLFRIRSDDYYSDWLIFSWTKWTKIWRRKDMYSDEQLKQLAASSIKESQKSYPPTFSEWASYIQTVYDNNNNNAEINKLYWIKEDESVIDLSSSEKANHVSSLTKDRLLKLNDMASENLEGDVINKFMINAHNILNSEMNRVSNYTNRIYAMEKLINYKDPSEVTEWEKEVLKSAELLRQMEDAYAGWIEDFLRQEMLYWVDPATWEISEVLDIFEWGKNLRDLLWWEVKRISWKEWGDYESAIDVIQRTANEAAYKYYEGKWKWHRKAKRWLDKIWWAIWYELSEVWQQWVKTLMDVWNLAWKAWTLQRWDLQDKLYWNEATNSVAEYMDQDFTIWRLIETDDWNAKRTIKKYYLQWLEYVPEWLWNLIPDIALVWLSWWTGAWVVAWTAWWLRNAIRWYKALKLWEYISKAAEWWRWLKWLNWLRWVSNAIKSWEVWAKWLDETVNTAKLIWWYVDNFLTRTATDQFIDSQWSLYDTEAYSMPSFIISWVGTVLWEWMPWMVNWWLFKILKNRSIDWTIWEPIKFLAQQENVDAVKPLFDKVWRKIWWMWWDQFQLLSKEYDTVKEATKKALDTLPQEGKDALNMFTKEQIWNWMRQAYNIDTTSELWRKIRNLIDNQKSNAADIFKYISKTPWDVDLLWWSSTIKLKNWTEWLVSSYWWGGQTTLDLIDWWFASKLKNWFTDRDIQQIFERTRYSDVLADNKSKYFDKVWDKYVLNDNWIKYFWVDVSKTPMETIWVDLARADNTKELFKKKLKDVTDRKISDTTINLVAETWTYDEVVDKIKEFIC